MVVMMAEMVQLEGGYGMEGGGWGEMGIDSLGGWVVHISSFGKEDTGIDSEVLDDPEG